MQSPSADTTCPTDDALAAFVEGRLELPHRSRVEAHLDACAACADVLAVYAQSYARGGSVPAPGVSYEKAVARIERKRSLLPGTAVGRYVVLERIGEGAAGVVYAAHDPELERRVALKLMPSENEETLSREARAMAKLAHPNVVSVHDVGRFEDRVFIAMEFVEGSTLRAWLCAEKRSQREILRAFADAGRGLAAAHTVGLVHRDFKPENVLVGKDGRVRVTDFGLARVAQEVTTPAGTPAYMAPEQRGGQAPDARSDQYSFCVALQEALRGQLPPAAGAPVPLRIRTILARGLARPEERYPSMDELLADLARDWTSRWRRGLTLALALAAIVSVVAAYQKGRHSSVAPESAAAAPVPAGPPSSPATALPAPRVPAEEPASPPKVLAPRTAPRAAAPRRAAADGGAASAAPFDPGSYQ